MYIWIIAWFCIKLEATVDFNTKNKLWLLSIIPCLDIVVSPKDKEGFRQYSLVFSILMFKSTLHFYLPAIKDFTRIIPHMSVVSN